MWGGVGGVCVMWVYVCMVCVCYLLIKHESELSCAACAECISPAELNWAQNPQQTNKPMFSIAKQKSMHHP